MGAPPYVPPTRPISTAQFWSNTYTFDPLYADAVISQSANIAGGLNAAGTVLARGTVLFGPASPAPITTATLLTTVPTGASARCILAADIDTSGGQVTGLVYTQGKFLDTAMTFSSQGAAADCASLWDYGIYVLTVEGRSGLLIPMMKLPTTGGPIPNAFSPKDAKQATEEQVKAIQAAVQNFRPEIVPPPPRGAQPAWATAAFGEAKPTPAEQEQEKLAEEAGDLAAKQKKALTDLEAKQSKELADLYEQQQKERAQFVKRAQEAEQRAQEAEQHPQPPQQPPQHHAHQPPPEEPPSGRKR